MSSEKFYELETKATAELQEAIQAELEVADPEPEKAKAILDGCSDDTDDTTSS